MTWSQIDIDALKAAIATGALTVTYPDGRSITYRSLRDMREIVGMMEREATPNPRRIGAFTLSPRNGY